MTMAFKPSTVWSNVAPRVLPMPALPMPLPMMPQRMTIFAAETICSLMLVLMVGMPASSSSSRRLSQDLNARSNRSVSPG